MNPPLEKETNIPKTNNPITISMLLLFFGFSRNLKYDIAKNIFMASAKSFSSLKNADPFICPPCNTPWMQRKIPHINHNNIIFRNIS
jgi:hypothetical protein